MKAKLLNKEQTTTPQVLYKPWCGLRYSLPLSFDALPN